MQGERKERSPARSAMIRRIIIGPWIFSRPDSETTNCDWGPRSCPIGRLLSQKFSFVVSGRGMDRRLFSSLKNKKTYTLLLSHHLPLRSNHGNFLDTLRRANPGSNPNPRLNNLLSPHRRTPPILLLNRSSHPSSHTLRLHRKTRQILKDMEIH